MLKAGLHMDVRPAADAESDIVDALLAAAYAGVIARMPAEDGRAFAAVLPSARAKYAEHGTWLVAISEEGICGCVAYFAPNSTQHPLFTGNSAHIQLLGVAPARRAAGIGRMLMERCLAMAKADGAADLLLQTSELMPEARRLYESLGFEVRATLPPVWGHPTYLYAKGEA